MRKKVEIFLIIIILTLIAVSSQKVSNLLYDNFISEDAVATAETIKIVVDSGHGGADPGKIGINNVLEKDINLKIASKLKELLEKNKIKVIMTRDTDASLADSKTEDMKKRVEIINEEKPVLCVSVHQNSYSDEAIKGAQVFYYSHSAKGELAAEILQQALLNVDSENTRQKKANDTYYILKKSEVPTVIVECGFLSNREESEKLNTDEYQQKIAEAIAAGVLEYLEL